MKDVAGVAIFLLLVVLVQTSVVWHFSLFGLVWLPVMHGVTFLALPQVRREGASWGFVAGLLLDLFSGTLWGASALAMTVAGFVAGLAATSALPHRLVLPGATTFWLAMTYYLILYVILVTLGTVLPFAAWLWQTVLPLTVFNALLAPFVLAGADRFVAMLTEERQVAVP